MICYLIIGEEIEKDMRAVKITKFNEFNGTPYEHIKKEYFYKFKSDKEKLGIVGLAEDEIEREESFHFFTPECSNKIFIGIIIQEVSDDIDELTTLVSDEDINNAKNKYKSLKSREGNLFLIID